MKKKYRLDQEKQIDYISKMKPDLLIEIFQYFTTSVVFTELNFVCCKFNTAIYDYKNSTKIWGKNLPDDAGLKMYVFMTYNMRQLQTLIFDISATILPGQKDFKILFYLPDDEEMTWSKNKKILRSFPNVKLFHRLESDNIDKFKIHNLDSSHKFIESFRKSKLCLKFRNEINQRIAMTHDGILHLCDINTNTFSYNGKSYVSKDIQTVMRDREVREIISLGNKWAFRGQPYGLAIHFKDNHLMVWDIDIPICFPYSEKLKFHLENIKQVQYVYPGVGSRFVKDLIVLDTDGRIILVEHKEAKELFPNNSLWPSENKVEQIVNIRGALAARLTEGKVIFWERNLSEYVAPYKPSNFRDQDLEKFLSGGVDKICGTKIVFAALKQGTVIFWDRNGKKVKLSDEWEKTLEKFQVQNIVANIDEGKFYFIGQNGLLDVTFYI